jgi:ABC-2 type transport system permease protein
MEKRLIQPIPSTSNALKTLLRADFTVQWRQRRALIMSLIVPIIFVVSWKTLIPDIGGDAVLAICIAIGLPAMGLMGYSLTIARDRERGIFQRLRAAPVPTWVIMVSRIVVQLVMIGLITLITIGVAAWYDKIYLSPPEVVLTTLMALIGGLAFVALGQAIVAYMQTSESVNAAARLIYFPIAIVGALGQIGLFGATVQKIVTYSPLGTTKTILAAGMQPSTFLTHDVLLALAITLGYGLIFAFIGIRNFRWTV